MGYQHVPGVLRCSPMDEAMWRARLEQIRQTWITMTMLQKLNRDWKSACDNCDLGFNSSDHLVAGYPKMTTTQAWALSRRISPESIPP